MLRRGISDAGLSRIASAVGYKVAYNLPEMFPVYSSNVESYGYDAENADLYVRFMAKGNSPSSLYVYRNVEPDTYFAFMEAESKGKFIWSDIRSRYEYERLE